LFRFRARQQQQRGQTLTVMAAAVFLMVLMLMATSRMGEHARRQWYLQTVADNAAYSGATLMARQFNVSAVLNRALIANQVAVAQWVGLASWLMMAKQAVFNTALLMMWIPGVQGFMMALMRAMSRVDDVVDPIIEKLLLFHAAVIKAISLALVALEAAMIAETWLSIRAVIEKHDPELDWDAFQGGSMVPFPALWVSMTNTRSTRKRSDSNFFKQLVLRSRDPFTTSRSYRWLEIMNTKVVKAGGNELETLANGIWNWNAIDSVAVHLKVFHRDYIVAPIGWGARASYRRYWASRGHHTVYGDAFSLNKQVTDLAWASMKSYRVAIPSFHYLTLRNHKKYGANALVVGIRDKATGQVAHARAEVRFSRPLSLFPRGDRQFESDNLFNALWEPNLVPLSNVDKAAIAAKEWARNG